MFRQTLPPVVSPSNVNSNPGLDMKINGDGLESFNNNDEEVIGIITMEDVLEQLLQEPIFDETDEYVDVHNKFKINLIPSDEHSSKSPGTASASQPKRQTPVTSPFSLTHQTPISYHHTPILRSPISPYNRSSITRPTLSASPRNSAATSPVGFTRPFCNSPSTYQVSRKSYEKLRKSGGS